MRVVIVTGIFPPDIGGPATHSEDLRATWVERGHDVVVVTLWDGAQPSFSRELVRFPRRWPWPARLAAVTAWLAARPRSFDAVYATGMLPAAVAGARLAKRPVVVKVVGDPVWERGRRLGLADGGFEDFQAGAPARGRLGAMRWLRDRSLRRATAITAPSAFLARVVDAWLGGPADVTVIPNGVRSAPDGVRSPTAAKGELRLCYVGRLVFHKQIDRIIGAVAATEGATLDVVGDGPGRPILEEAAAHLGVAARVRFHGDLDHAEVMTRIGRSDALVLASDYEGLPHVVIEALAVGTPVVSPSVGGVGEVVADGLSGLIVADARVETLAAAFERLRDDPPLRARLAEGARTAGTEWHMDATADRIEDLLARAARPKPRFVFLGKDALPQPLTPDGYRKVAGLLAYAEPIFVGAGHVPSQQPGRARRISIPRMRPRAVASVLYYVAAPMIGVGLTAGRSRAAIICQSPYEGVGVIALSRMLPAGIRPRVVVELHGDFRTASRLYGDPSRAFLSPAADRAAAWALRRADRVRVVAKAGEAIAREAGYRGPVDRFVAYIDVGGFLASPPLAPPLDPVVLFAGVFERYKAVDVLIEAWADVAGRVPGARLLLAGEGPLRAELERRATGSLPDGSFRFLGSVPKARIADLLDGARLLVVPSRSEGLPRIVFEAFARARPVVATPVGGVAEAVVPGETGALVPVGDPSALAEALVRMLEDPEGSRRMGEAGAALLRERDPGSEFDRGMASLAAWAAGPPAGTDG